MYGVIIAYMSDKEYYKEMGKVCFLRVEVMFILNYVILRNFTVKLQSCLLRPDAKLVSCFVQQKKM